ncbi:MAG: tetratricopeptide repeat protein [Deltaproteobacteria bacterium]|mgnify:CR=1 FL=1
MRKRNQPKRRLEALGLSFVKYVRPAETRPKRGGRAVFVLFLSCLAFTAFLGCSTRDPAEASFNAAEEAFGNGRFREALNAYADVVNKHRASAYAPKSQLRIAVIYNRHLNDAKKAAHAYTSLFLMYPKAVEALSGMEDMAGIYSSAGEYSKSVEVYQRLKTALPAEAERFQFMIASEYIKMNDLHQARIELKDILASSSNQALSAAIRLKLADTYYVEGDVKQAIGAYDEVIILFPESDAAMEAMLGKAAALLEAGKKPEALKTLSELELKSPEAAYVKAGIKRIRARAAAEDKAIISDESR